MTLGPLPSTKLKGWVNKIQKSGKFGLVFLVCGLVGRPLVGDSSSKSDLASGVRRRLSNFFEMLVGWSQLAKTLNKGGIPSRMRSYISVLISDLVKDIKTGAKQAVVGKSKQVVWYFFELSLLSLFKLIPPIVTISCVLLTGTTNPTISSNQLQSDPIRSIGYARVSDSDQVKNGYSLNDQHELIEQMASDWNVKNLKEIIKDKGKTGTDFDRLGIKRVLEMAKKGDIDVVFVSHIDRLGRSHVLTLCFIHILTVELDITIITPNGPLDIKNEAGMITITMKTLIAEMESRRKGVQSLRVKARNFLENRLWESWYGTRPLGYASTPDGWVKKNAEEKGVALFNYFKETKVYAETSRRLKANEASDEAEEITPRKVKKWLQNPIYKGEPGIPIENVKGYNHKGWIDASELAMVDEGTFQEVQEIIEKKSKSTTSDEETKGTDEVLELFHWYSLGEISPIVELLCPECNSELVKDGCDKLRDEICRHMYVCSDETCGSQRVWPNEEEIQKLETLELLVSNKKVRKEFLG